MRGVGAPRSVVASLRLEEVQRVRGSRVVEVAALGQRPQPGQDVVVPVRRVVELNDRRVHRPAAPLRPGHPVPEEELRGPIDPGQDRRRHRRIGRGPAERGQASEGREALVGRGVCRVLVTIAVPAAVGPLPVEELLDEQPRPGMVGVTEMDRHGQGVALDRRALPAEAPDDRHLLGPEWLAPTRDPRQDPVRGVAGFGQVARQSEVHQRRHPPMEPEPLAVRMAPRHVRQERPDDRPVRDRGPRLRRPRIGLGDSDQLDQRPVAEQRLVRPEEEFDARIDRHRRHRQIVRRDAPGAPATTLSRCTP
jgi:hypothetical protein